MLDGLPFDGFPQSEQDRRAAWLGVPRAARAAIRRLHTKIGHKPRAVLVQILCGAGADPKNIEGVKWFKGDDCASVAPASSVAPTKAPSLYAFNFEVIVDILYAHDYDGTLHQFISIVGNGTTFYVVAWVREGSGTPTSERCWSKFTSRWGSWAGFPQGLSADRGLHNRGAFARGLSANGTYLRQAALEAPDHIGRGERHGCIFKELLKKVVKLHSLRGKAQMKEAAAIA